KANTTYIVSYFAPQGNYAVNLDYFVSGFDNHPLHALSDAASGGNGVFHQGPAGGFPDSNLGAPNYWVDVVFNSSNSVPPQVVSTTPAPGAINVSTDVAPAAAFSESLDPMSMNDSTVLLTDTANNPVPISISYDASDVAITLTPLQRLQTEQ